MIEAVRLPSSEGGVRDAPAGSRALFGGIYRSHSENMQVILPAHCSVSRHRHQVSSWLSCRPGRNRPGCTPPCRRGLVATPAITRFSKRFAVCGVALKLGEVHRYGLRRRFRHGRPRNYPSKASDVRSMRTGDQAVQLGLGGETSFAAGVDGVYSGTSRLKPSDDR